MGGLTLKPCYKKSRELASAKMPPHHTQEMRDDSRSKILLLELHIEGCQVGWREFCILSLMDFAQECCWVCSSLLGVSLQNVMYEATYVKLNIF